MADNIVNKDNLRLRYYNIVIDLIDNGVNENIPEICLQTLSVENDYRGNFFPIMRIELVIKKEMYQLIIDRKDNIKFRIRFEAFQKDGTYGINGLERKGSPEVVFNEIFHPIITDVSQDTRSGMVDSSALAEGPKVYLEVYLFKADSMNINKNIVNFIAKDCKAKDAVGYIFKQTKVDKVLMEAPNMDTVHKQVLIPPMNLRNSIKFLAENYGIYKSGIRQFYDFDRYYLMSNNLDRIPAENGEYTNVYVNVTKMSNINSVNEGSYEDTANRCYVVNTQNTIRITNNSSVNKEINGSTLKSYSRESMESAVSYNSDNGKFSFNSGYTETKVDTDGHGKNSKSNYTYDSTGNSSTVNNYVKQTQMSNTEFILDFNNIDLTIFKLNRAYIFRFEDQEFAASYNGRYMLEYLVYMINENLGEIQAVCKFRKEN